MAVTSSLDRAISALDTALRTVFAPAQAARPSPANEVIQMAIEGTQRANAARLMRVNHVGEICAQALYQGQALTARDPAVRAALESAARDEEDHLAWCEQRIDELGGRKSLLNPLWYAGSFALGAASGLLGDKINLAFLAETERQVEGHLKDHLERLASDDAKSRAILEQMKSDEARHGASAVALGAAEMPAPVKALMTLTSRMMTATAYWV